MNVNSVKIIVLLSVSIACNEYTPSFTQDVNNKEQKPLEPPDPVDVSGLEHNNAEPRVINDKQRDDFKIKPDNAVAGLTRSFRANPSHSGEVMVDFQRAIVDNTVKMSAELIGESREFKQLVRPVYSSKFKQTGTHGEAVTENFTQNEKGILDILMVIDNSGSMEEAQENIAQGLPALLNYVAGSNWQIAITSTDRRECIRRIITADTVDYEQVFAETIKGLGINGSSTEEAILMTQRGLLGECQGKTTPWLRDNASLAIIIVTDEDHQCYKNLTYKKSHKQADKIETCRNREDSYTKQLADFYQPIDDLYSYLQQTHVLGSSAKIYGIINPKDNYQKTNWVLGGSKWFVTWRSKDGKRKLFDQRANIFADRDGYDTILQNISADIRVILKDQFMLQRAPSAGTMVVKVTAEGETKELHTDEYMIKDNILTLSQKPPKGASIDVQYAYNAEPDVKEFTLPQLPLPGSVSIEIDDNGHVITADPGLYMRVDQQIKFHTAPPKGSTLTISYKENFPLRTSLQLGKGKITQLAVTVDDEEIDTYTLDPLTNLITFDADALPAEGTLVKAVYNAVLEENLTYALTRHDSLRDNNNLLCFSADDPLLGVGCEWQRIDGKDYVLFSAGEFVSERYVIVRQLLDIETNNIELQEHYLPETIKLQVGVELCYASDLVIENNMILLDEYQAESLCPHLSSADQITLNYDYIDLKQTFSVEKEFFDSHPHEYEHWEIKVNGEKVPDTDFKVANHTAEFNYRLPPDAVVEVKISLY